MGHSRVSWRGAPGPLRKWATLAAICPHQATSQGPERPALGHIIPLASVCSHMFTLCNLFRTFIHIPAKYFGWEVLYLWGSPCDHSGFFLPESLYSPCVDVSISDGSLTMEGPTLWGTPPQGRGSPSNARHGPAHLSTWCFSVAPGHLR